MKPNKTTFKQTEIGMIPEDWEVKELGEEIELAYGKGLIENKRVFGEYPVFGSNGIIGFHAEAFVKGPGIIIGRKGSVGEVKFSRKDFWPIDTTYYVKLKKQGNIFFWYYFLMSLGLNKLNSHSAVPGLNRDQVYQIVSKIPPLPEQRAIAKILSSLDAKIELNQQMNKTLEEIGKAIFKHWFVDFEFPNEEGKPYKSSGGDMVFDEELGKEIPKGWYVGCLEEFGAFKNGINYLRNESGDTEFFIANVRDIANNKLLLKEHLDKIEINLKKAKEYLLHNRDILIARSASPGEVSLVLGDLENVIYSGFSIRYRLNNPENFLYFFLILQKLKENLSNYAVGTTLQSVNQETLRNMKLVLPTNEVLNKFNKIIGQILGKTYNNLIQNQTLSSIRDSLLPKLMSGKIRVPIEEKS